MSWEEMYTRSTVCPCGKGKLTQKTYGDDWNRYEEEAVIIECEECVKKYKIETITHRGLLSSDGVWSTNYLTPIDYPEYTGIQENDLYPPTASMYDDFPTWLIENYTENELIEVKCRIKSTTSSARLTGDAARIRDLHRKALNNVRIGEILKNVDAALRRYSEHSGNKLQREEVRKQQNAEYSAYNEEKRKHQSIIELK
ncbi:MAG: hypothetical protein IKK66_04990 [Ruminococcus sp.]|nr:hypothetical protein [Ruminococcus sp.]